MAAERGSTPARSRPGWCARASLRVEYLLAAEGIEPPDGSLPAGAAGAVQR